MCEKILKNDPPLTHLNLERFEFGITKEQSRQLLDALASLTQPTLLYLNLSSDWYNFDSLLEVLKRQDNIQELDLDNCGFDSD